MLNLENMSRPVIIQEITTDAWTLCREEEEEDDEEEMIEALNEVMSENN
jgi:hypothetical protein